ALPICSSSWRWAGGMRVMADAAAVHALPSAETRIAHLAAGWEAPSLFLIAVLLLCFGLVTVYSTSAVMAASAGLPDYYYVVQQATGGVLGLLALAFMARLDYRTLRLLAWPI